MTESGVHARQKKKKNKRRAERNGFWPLSKPSLSGKIIPNIALLNSFLWRKKDRFRKHFIINSSMPWPFAKRVGKRRGSKVNWKENRWCSTSLFKATNEASKKFSHQFVFAKTSYLGRSRIIHPLRSVILVGRDRDTSFAKFKPNPRSLFRFSKAIVSTFFEASKCQVRLQMIRFMPCSQCWDEIRRNWTRVRTDRYMHGGNDKRVYQASATREMFPWSSLNTPSCY